MALHQRRRKTRVADLKACSRQHRIVLVTAPSLEVARALARAALEKRLVACANLVPGLESHYWWQGRIESAPEVLILFKTRQPLVAALQRLVSALHPYDTPEFVLLPVTAAATKYLQWWNQETQPGRRQAAGQGSGERNAP